MTAPKVGDLAEWPLVPDGAMVRRSVEGGAFFYLRSGDDGWCVGKICEDGDLYFERMPGNPWSWRHKAARAAQVTIVALDLTGQETAADLQRLAEVFEVREAVCSFIRTSGEVHAAICAFMISERGRGRCTVEEAATRAAERLHALGWRKGQTAEDAARLLAAAGK